MFDFELAFDHLRATGHGEWADVLQRKCVQAVADDSHGLLAVWMATVEKFKQGCATDVTIEHGHVVAGEAAAGKATASGDVTADGAAVTDASRQTSTEDLVADLMKLHPWRKGPVKICGQTINTEWRSDWKWDRVHNFVELRDRLVLDVGCGNGYFGYRMLDAGASMVIGLDPFHLFVMQHELMKRLIGPVPNFVLPVADTVLHRKLKAFDVAFSMGVLYHRTSPIDHLQVLSGSVKRGGQVVLETLVIDDKTETVLVPEGRYAMMRNVWFLPSVSMLRTWMKRTGFENLKVVDVTKTTIEEQRSTEWMRFDSLPDFLDPTDHSKTAEGHPAPLRATIVATVK